MHKRKNPNKNTDTHKIKTSMKQTEKKLLERRFRQAIKDYGFVLPTTPEEVRRFEELYGDTDLEMPEEVVNPKYIWDKIQKEEACDSPFSMAARQGKEDIPDHILERMKNDWDAVKNQN